LDLVLADPPGIVIPSEFAGLTEVLQTFCLTRAVAAIALGQEMVMAHGLEATRRLLSASCLALGVRPPDSEPPEDDVAELSRRISKALPWLAKGRFEDAARRYATLPSAALGDGLAEGTEALRNAAYRIALVVCDDVAALDFLRGAGRATLGLSEQEAQVIYKDLLAFWVSEEAMGLRRRLGLA
jgi:hypothetical protein